MTHGTRARTAGTTGLLLLAAAVPGTAAAAADSPDSPDPPAGPPAAHRATDPGLEGLSGREVADKAQRQLGSQSALRLSMSSEAVRLKLALDEDGNCKGVMSMAGQGSVKMVKRGDTAWIKPDAAFWKSQLGGDRGAAVAKSFKGRYIKGTADDPMMGGLRTTCDLDALQAALGADRSGPGDTGPSPSTGDWERGAERDVAGTRAVPVTRTADGQKTTLLVAAEGKPRPLKVIHKADGVTDVMKLSGFGRPVPKKTPPAKKTVDVSELRKQLETPTENV